MNPTHGRAAAARRAALAALVALGLLLGAAGTSGAQDAPERPALGIPVNRDCGAYCAGVVLRRLDLAVPDFESLKSACRVDAEGVTDLGAIAAALTDLGVETEVGELRDEPPDCVAVALVRPGRGEVAHDFNHFVVIEPGERRPVVYCPPFWTLDVEWAQLRREIDGPLLLCRERPRLPTYLGGALLLVGLAGAGAAAWARRGRGRDADGGGAA